jgi:DNA-binding CsgD family transcriptional regulator
METAESYHVAANFAGLALEWLRADRACRLLITRNFGVLWANDAAIAELTAGRELELRDDRLMIAEGAHQYQLGLAMSAASAGHYWLPCADGQGHFVIQFDMVGDADDAAVFGLVIRRCGGHRPVPAADLARLFGLTAGEHRVVRKLLEGLPAEDTAASLGIGIETVRSHIRQVYSKLGVRSREALFQRITSYCV